MALPVTSAPDTLTFVKMQSLGNDFVLIEGEPHLWMPKIPLVADRRLGIGCDQIIFLTRRGEHLWELSFANADGSLAKACGNGTRCAVGWVCAQHTYPPLKPLHFVTPSGPLRGWLTPSGEGAVDHPKPTLLFPEPFPVEISSRDFAQGWAVEVGNPHLVMCVTSLESLDLHVLGPSLERHPAFPGGVNVNFVQERPLSQGHEIYVRTWERGAGLTPACGTGACASAFVWLQKRVQRTVQGMSQKIISPGSHGPVGEPPLTVHMDGGSLTVQVSGDRLIHTAPFQKVFQGWGEF